jgi:adenylate cyclase
MSHTPGPRRDRQRHYDMHTFLFADLAGFTALTEAHRPEQAADIAHEFSRATAELLPLHSAEQTKTIGDALMLLVDAPAEAAV